LKSTYKLFGVMWDGMLIPEIIPVVIESVDNVGRCQVNISSLLCINDKFEMEELIEEKGVDLILDYVPQNDSLVIQEFYIKRILQMIYFLQDSNVVVQVVAEREKVNYVNKMICACYKKTSHRLLAQSSDVLM